jgi:hypothetical protein
MEGQVGLWCLRELLDVRVGRELDLIRLWRAYGVWKFFCLSEVPLGPHLMLDHELFRERTYVCMQQYFRSFP